jgi:hypothetical protein
MAELYCPKCGPIRTTYTRSSAGLDLNSLSSGPVPGSKCFHCGRQLHVGDPNSTFSSGCLGVTILLLTSIGGVIAGIWMLS